MLAGLVVELLARRGTELESHYNPGVLRAKNILYSIKGLGIIAIPVGTNATHSGSHKAQHG